MPKILGALTAIGGNEFSGYLVVVEVPETDMLNLNEYLDSF